ncbi:MULTISPECIES: transcriptional regulator GutM [unclassified Luteococcus]|uniref:transcriptional regulator GutM n=1 Tax=unclassified Luteococcus TaxID=2639923 RepID=UPI00313AEC2C
MFWPIIIAFGVFYVIQTVLALRQANSYARTFGALRRRGRVAIGKQKNLVLSGAIVMFLLDEQDRIVEATRLSGVTVFSRFRRLTTFDGQTMRDVDATQHRELSSSLRAAIVNARDNFLLVSEGRIPPEPPGPITKLFTRRKQQAFA